MHKFSFVILHYLTIDDTIKCVESILKNVKYPEFNIIIVDNASPDNSGQKLIEQYKENSTVKIIRNPVNLGFANGNNEGFNFAKEQYKSDFIALLNNDTIIEDVNFVDAIILKYQKTNFDVFGPDVISTATGRHQNPRSLTICNKNRLKNLIIHHRIKLWLNYLFADQTIENIKKKVFPVPLVSGSVSKNYNPAVDHVGVKLSGCCLVFGPEYIKKYNGLFSGTFLFSEEEILYYICKRDNLKIIYSPDTQIFHREDATLDLLYRKNYKKRRFYYKNYIKSGKAFLKLIEEDNILEDWDDKM